MPVAAVRTADWDVRVARYAPSSNVSYVMFTGGDLVWAERAMKAGDRAVEPAITGTRPDLTGLLCPLQEFPAQRGVVLSPIADLVSGEDNPAFRELVCDILWMTGQKNEATHPTLDPLRALTWLPSGLDLRHERLASRTKDWLGASWSWGYGAWHLGRPSASDCRLAGSGPVAPLARWSPMQIAANTEMRYARR
jgi:hypothetical protein